MPVVDVFISQPKIFRRSKSEAPIESRAAQHNNRIDFVGKTSIQSHTD